MKRFLAAVVAVIALAFVQTTPTALAHHPTVNGTPVCTTPLNGTWFVQGMTIGNSESDASQESRLVTPFNNGTHTHAGKAMLVTANATVSSGTFSGLASGTVIANGGTVPATLTGLSASSVTVTVTGFWNFRNASNNSNSGWSDTTNTNAVVIPKGSINCTPVPTPTPVPPTPTPVPPTPTPVPPTPTPVPPTPTPVPPTPTTVPPTPTTVPPTPTTVPPTPTTVPPTPTTVPPTPTTVPPTNTPVPPTSTIVPPTSTPPTVFIVETSRCFNGFLTTWRNGIVVSQVADATCNPLVIIQRQIQVVHTATSSREVVVVEKLVPTTPAVAPPRTGDGGLVQNFGFGPGDDYHAYRYLLIPALIVTFGLLVLCIHKGGMHN